MNTIKRNSRWERFIWYWEILIDGEVYQWGRTKQWRTANKCLNKYEKEANKLVKQRNKSNSR